MDLKSFFEGCIEFKDSAMEVGEEFSDWLREKTGENSGDCAFGILCSALCAFIACVVCYFFMKAAIWVVAALSTVVAWLFVAAVGLFLGMALISAAISISKPKNLPAEVDVSDE